VGRGTPVYGDMPLGTEYGFWPPEQGTQFYASLS